MISEAGVLGTERATTARRSFVDWIRSAFTARVDTAATDRSVRFSHHSRILRQAVELIDGNQASVLVDGPATHEAMFDAIAAARDHINIESYIVESEGPGRQLADILIRKCAEGVRVNMIYDSYGSWTTRARYFAALRKAGVQLLEFNPLNPFRHPIAWTMHLRDHRKLLIVDGRVAFIGGVNISSVYSTRKSAERAADRPMARWRDSHLRVEGPVVACLQRLFLQHWESNGGAELQPADYSPELVSKGHQRVAVAACAAGRRRNPYYRALLGAIEGARYSVHVTASYFVPTRGLTRALTRAARRGVDVRLALPGVSDSWTSLAAGRSVYDRLLRAGVRIYERHNAMLHAKSVVIDGIWLTVGSSNMDWRSLLHNAEANVVVLDVTLAAEFEELFARDIAESREIRLAQWSARSWKSRAFEWVARRLQFYL